MRLARTVCSASVRAYSNTTLATMPSSRRPYTCASGSKNRSLAIETAWEPARPHTSPSAKLAAKAKGANVMPMAAVSTRAPAAPTVRPAVEAALSTKKPATLAWATCEASATEAAPLARASAASAEEPSEVGAPFASLRRPASQPSSAAPRPRGSLQATAPVAGL